MKARGTRIISDVKQYSPDEIEAFVRENPEITKPASRETVPDLPEIPNMIMIKRGKPVNPAPLRLIVSNDEQKAALDERTEEEAELRATVAKAKNDYREQVKDDEKRRVDQVKRKKSNRQRGSVRTEVVQTDGRTHTVKKVQTTASRMVASGKLPKDLYSQLTAFAQLVAQALGVAVHDGEDSTAKMISHYDSVGGGTFGSRTPRDSVLDARTELREIGQLVPPEMQECFVQIVGEEVGSLIGKPMTLDQIGERRGYHHKQASASGGTQVYDVVALICHLAKMRGTLSRQNILAMRHFAATQAETS